MASFLLSECLENIFLYLDEVNEPPSSTSKYKDLHSCTLVSRHWCRISTPFLYAYPFHPFCYSSWCSINDLISYSKFIRTLLSCVPQIEIKRICTTYAQVLSAKHIPLNKTFSCSSTFNYVSFIRGLILNETFLNSQNLLNYKAIWLSAHNQELLSASTIIKVMNHFLEFLIENCNNLAMLEISLTMDSSNSIKLSQFITSLLLHQRGLKHIKISGYFVINNTWDAPDLSVYSAILNLLPTQSKSLQKLEFESLSFDNIGLNSLCLVKNIRELKLNMIGFSSSLSSWSCWAKNLTKLRVLEISNYSSHSKDFIIQLFQLFSNTLVKLIIADCNTLEPYPDIENLMMGSLYQQVSLHLHSLIHLEVPLIYPTELISIFKSCSQLVYLSVKLISDENLKSLGEFIPKTLKRIHFIFVTVTHFEESLRCFLEGYINNDGSLRSLVFKHNRRWFNNNGHKSLVYKKSDIQITLIEL